MKQNQALKILHSGQNVFLTGSAGTGKTFLLNRFIAELGKKKLKVAITASTGIAATHIGGRTIHSWSGMGIEQKMTDKEIKKLVSKKKLLSRIRSTDVLIIDEISMLDADRLDLLDEICKSVKDPFVAFGGIQVVFCGDFFQLPPVSKGQAPRFAYDSFVWRKSAIRVCYLEEQFRQDDRRLINILNSIRTNQAGPREIELLNSRLRKSVGKVKPTKLYTHNIDVDTINGLELSKIKKKEKTFKMTSHGPKDLVKFLKKSCLAPEKLKLKVGAKVMFVRNNFESGYVNGTLGVVTGFDEGAPVVKIKGGKKIIVEPESWNVEGDDQAVGGIKQVPLRLAWAITIHKSQGMSLDSAEIDLSKTFERGMGYVALSRVRTLDGIRLLGISQLALLVDPEVVEKDKEFRKLGLSV